MELTISHLNQEKTEHAIKIFGENITLDASKNVKLTLDNEQLDELIKGLNELKSK